MPQGGPSAMNLDPIAAAPSAAVNTASDDDDLPF
jgi:hypothetical protein